MLMLTKSAVTLYNKRWIYLTKSLLIARKYCNASGFMAIEKSFGSHLINPWLEEVFM